MDKELLHQLETPCVVLDTRMAEENIKKMQAACDACGVKLRPHIKTHKMPLFAKMQLAAGADGVTCAKVGEAEVMADGGVEDIFIAYPMVGDFRVRRVIALAKRLRRLILGVDSMEIAQPLSAPRRKPVSRWRYALRWIPAPSAPAWSATRLRRWLWPSMRCPT